MCVIKKRFSIRASMRRSQGFSKVLSLMVCFPKFACITLLGLENVQREKCNYGIRAAQK